MCNLHEKNTASTRDTQVMLPTLVTHLMPALLLLGPQQLPRGFCQMGTLSRMLTRLETMRLQTHPLVAMVVGLRRIALTQPWGLAIPTWKEKKGFPDKR